MKELEKIVANNITELRKSQKWTQAELAEKINYSDKSVSKWERGDSIPDVGVLNDMAKLFGVTLDYFVNENAPSEKNKYMVNKTEAGYRLAVALLTVVVVWFVATVYFVYLQIYKGQNYWMAFIWAVPISLIILQRNDRKWFRRKYEVIINSLLCWTSITAAFLHCLVFRGVNLWVIYFVGVPIQIGIILLFYARKSK